jgi:hypothetical protein
MARGSGYPVQFTGSATAVGVGVAVGAGVGVGSGVGVGVGIAVGVGVGPFGSTTTTGCRTDDVVTLPSLTDSPTTYVPGAGNVWIGDASKLGSDPSPKLHHHVLGAPVDVSWNVTSRFVGDCWNVKSAVRGTGVGVGSGVGVGVGVGDGVGVAVGVGNPVGVAVGVGVGVPVGVNVDVAVGV